MRPLADNPQHPPTIDLHGARLRRPRLADAAALHDYLRDPARGLLEHQRLPVNVAAYEVGYESPSQFSREFKLEAVNLIRERGVSYAQASRDLDVNVNMLRRWAKEFGSDPKQAFPGLGQMKPEQLEIDRLRKEVAKLKAERDILKKAAAYFAKEVT